MKIHQHINAIYQIAYSLPEILIAILIILSACFTWLSHTKSVNKLLPKTMCIGLFSIFLIILIYSTSNIQVYTRLFAYNSFSYQFKTMLLGTSAFLSLFLCTKSIIKTKRNSSYILWLGLLFSLMLMSSANSLITIYISMELYTISLCFLISTDINNEEATKASFKFLIQSAIMSCIFLYGVSLYYFDIGSVSFYSMGIFQTGIAGTVGLILVISYFLFKLNAAPFHLWSINVYESSPTHVVLFLDTIVKFIIFTVFASLCINLFLNEIVFFQNFLLIISVISMIIGGVAPFVQNNIKKFLAYSSVGHIGFLITILAVFDDIAQISYGITYMFSYTLSAICFFCGLIGLSRHINVSLFSDLKGTIKVYPIYAYSIICGLFSMAGSPPFIGFIAKIGMFNEMIKHDMICVCVIMIIYSILSVSYTVKALKHIFIKGIIEKRQKNSVLSNLINTLMIASLVIFNVLFRYIDKHGEEVIKSLKLYYDYVESESKLSTRKIRLGDDRVKKL